MSNDYISSSENKLRHGLQDDACAGQVHSRGRKAIRCRDLQHRKWLGVRKQTFKKKQKKKLLNNKSVHNSKYRLQSSVIRRSIVIIRGFQVQMCQSYLQLFGDDSDTHSPAGDVLYGRERKHSGASGSTGAPPTGHLCYTGITHSPACCRLKTVTAAGLSDCL